MMKNAALAVPEMHLNPAAIFHPQDFVDTKAVIVAVSGGSDSMAMLLLLRDHLANMARSPRLVAVTIDHGLRPQSLEEAQWVAEFCASQAIRHDIVLWQGEKPRTALQASARHARYQLLCAQARIHAARVIVTGHTLDDQAETYLMRAARLRSADKRAFLPRGLAAMSRQSLLFNEICLIRPLLGLRRAALRRFLENRRVGWLDDPSNEDRRFERVRLRQSLDEVTMLAAAQSARQAARQRVDYNARIIEWIQKGVCARLGEVYQFDLASMSVDDLFLPQFLADMACLVGGVGHLRPAPPSFFDLLKQNTPARFNWAGAMIEKKGLRLRLWRECRNLDHCRLGSHATLIWDRRYRIVNHGDDGLVVRPAKISELRHFARSLNLPSMALQATPVIEGASGQVFPVLEQCLKSVKRFSDKNCGNNKEREHLAESLSAKNALNGAFRYSKQVSLSRILAPFEFLQRQDDHHLIACWRQIFNFAS